MQDIQSDFFEKSLKLVPGGVHSPVRSFKGLDSTPRFIKEAHGAMITDVSGKDYIDFCMSFGPLILGHQNESVKAKLKEAIDRGWSFGTCEPYSLDLAQFLIDKIGYPVEQIRFVNSGTEAVMTALRLARGTTKKDKIIKFNGCYHGHTDSMLIKAGSGLAGTATASSAGIPDNVAADTLILELTDTEGLKQCFKDHPGQIAAVIVEPLPANNGLLIQTKEYLQFIRDITSENQALLIFDEVISGFRTGFGGMANKFGIVPDLITYGKIIGGGLPVGAIAGPIKIMQNLSPVGDVYQAGTLSANPLAMVAGLATLSQLNNESYAQMTKQTKAIADTFSEWFKDYNNGEFSDFNIRYTESLFWITTLDPSINKVSDINIDLTKKFNPLFELLLAKGIYLSPNAYEVGFVSMAHDENIILELKNRLWKK